MCLILLLLLLKGDLHFPQTDFLQKISLKKMKHLQQNKKFYLIPKDCKKAFEFGSRPKKFFNISFSSIVDAFSSIFFL